MRPVLSVKAPRERGERLPRAVLLVAALIAFWSLGSGWWYTCRIKQVCSSHAGTAEVVADVHDNTAAEAPPPADETAPDAATEPPPAAPGEPAATVTAAALSTAPADEPAPAAPVPEPALVAYFGRKSTEIVVPPESEAALPALVAAAQQGAAIKIVGHSDGRGRPELKAELSAQRAIMLRDWLIAHGVAAEAITTLESHEDREPVADNTTSEGRAKNRRAVATVITQGE